METKILLEELQRINKLMGNKKILLESVLPLLRNLATDLIDDLIQIAERKLGRTINQLSDLAPTELITILKSQEASSIRKALYTEIQNSVGLTTQKMQTKTYAELIHEIGLKGVSDIDIAKGALNNFNKKTGTDTKDAFFSKLNQNTGQRAAITVDDIVKTYELDPLVADMLALPGTKRKFRDWLKNEAKVKNKTPEQLLNDAVEINGYFTKVRQGLEDGTIKTNMRVEQVLDFLAGLLSKRNLKAAGTVALILLALGVITWSDVGKIFKNLLPKSDSNTGGEQSSGNKPKEKVSW